MLSYDPITGKVTLIGKLPEEETVPIVTPDQSQAKPKASPEGGSAPPIRPKNYYLRGETVPEGIETELDMVEEDGRKFLARVPVVPKMPFEDKQRIEAETAKATLGTFYDLDKNKFEYGLVEAQPAVPVSTDKVSTIGDYVQTGINKVELMSKKSQLGEQYRAAEVLAQTEGYDKHKPELERIRNEIVANEQALIAEDMRSKDADGGGNDYLSSVFNFISSPLNPANTIELTKQTAKELPTMVLPLVEEGLLPGVAGAGAGALGGSVVPGAGTATGAGAGFAAGVWSGMYSYYANRNIADQVLHNTYKASEIYDLDKIPDKDLESLYTTDISRARFGAATEASLDAFTGLLIKGTGNVILKGALPKAVSKFVPAAVRNSPLAARSIGLLGSSILQYPTEAGQELAEAYGGRPGLGLGELLTDPAILDEANQAGQMGFFMGLTLGGVANLGRSAGTVAKAAYNKARGRGGKKKADAEGDADTSAFEVETGGGPLTVVEPDVSVKPSTRLTLTERLAVADEPRFVDETKGEKKTKPDGGKKPWDVWNDYYKEQVGSFEEAQKGLTPADAYNMATAKGSEGALAQTFATVAGPEAKPSDNTFPVKVANNLVKGLDTSIKTNDFYANFKNNPVALTTFAEAIEASLSDPVRQEKIAVAKAAVPSLSDVAANTLSTKALDSIVDNFIKKTEPERSVWEALGSGETLSKKAEAAFKKAELEGAKTELANQSDAWGDIANKVSPPQVASAIAAEAAATPTTTPDAKKTPKTVWDKWVARNAAKIKKEPQFAQDVWDNYRDIWAEAAKMYPATVPEPPVTNVPLPDYLNAVEGKPAPTQDATQTVPPSPSFENVDKVESVILADAPPSSPKTQLGGVVKSSKRKKKRGSSLDIPDLLSGTNKDALFAGDNKAEKTLTPEALYSDDPITNMEYVPVLNDSLDPSLVDEVTKFASGVKGVIESVARRILGQKQGDALVAVVADDIIAERTNPTTGNKTYTRVGGEQQNLSNGIRAVIINIGHDIREAVGQTLTQTDINDTFETIVHELAHVIDTNDFLSKDLQRVIQKALGDLQKELVKTRPDMVDLIASFDVNTLKGRQELFAYAVADYASKSDNPAAVELRKAFGAQKQSEVDYKDPSNPALRRVLNAILRALKAVKDYTRSMVDRSFANRRNAERVFDKMLSGKLGGMFDKAYVASQERQLNSVVDSVVEADKQRSFAAATTKAPTSKEITEDLKKTFKRMGEIAREIPLEPVTQEDVIKDKGNTRGWGNKYLSSLNYFRNFTNQADVDADYAHALELVRAKEGVSAKLHGEWAKYGEWITNHPHAKAMFQMALDLRKQGVSLNGDGPIYYTNRQGKNVQITPETVETVRNFSKIYSMPLNFLSKVVRGKLEGISKLPGFDTLPFNKPAKVIKDWLSEKQKELKDQFRSDAKERLFLRRAQDFATSLDSYEAYMKSGVPYVPEMRRGNWAITAEDKDGNLVGMWTFVSPDGKPNKKEVQKAYNDAVAKYKNTPDIRITKPDDVFEMTYNAIGRRIKNKSQIDMSLVAYLFTQKAMGLLKDSGKFSSEDLDMIRKGSLSEDVMAYIKFNGFAKHLISSKHIDGASEDVNWVTGQFFNVGAKSSADALYSELYNTTLGAYTIASAGDANTPTKRKYQHLKEFLEYAANPDADAPFLRTLSYLWTLGGNFATAVVQLASLITTAPAVQISLGLPLKTSYSSMLNAMRYVGTLYTKVLDSDGRKLSWNDPQILRVMKPFFPSSEKGKAAFEYALKSASEDSAILHASLPDEANRSILDNSEVSEFATNWQKFKDKSDKALAAVSKASGQMMSFTERAARTGVYFATIKQLFLGGKPVIDRALGILSKNPRFKSFRSFNPQLDDARAITLFSIMESFGNPEKSARAPYTRGWAGALIFPFQNIVSQLYGKMTGLMLGRRGVRGQAAYAFTLAQMSVLVGLNGSLGTLAPVTALALQYGLLGDKDEPGELQIKEWLVDSMLGQSIKDFTGMSDKEVANLMYSGVLSSMAGTDLSQRLALGSPFVKYGKDFADMLASGEVAPASTFLGIPGNLAATAIKGMGQISQGRSDAGDLALALAPAALKNPITAIDMAVRRDTGVKKTSLGKPIMRFSDMSDTDLILRAMGFQSNTEKDANTRNFAANLAGASKNSFVTNTKSRLIHLGAKIETTSDPSERYELKQEYNKLRDKLYSVALEMKETDPQEYDLYFSDERLKQFERDVKLGIKRMVDPRTTEGLSEKEIIGVTKADRFTGRD